MPRFKTIVNTGAEYGTITVRAATAVVAGEVLQWEMDGTEDGLSVDNAHGTRAALTCGIAPAAIAAGEKGEVICYGLATNARILRLGSASNDGVAVGDVLDIHSASSCLSYAVAGGAVLETASNAGACPPMLVAAEAVASGGASSLSTTTTKCFVRCM